MSAHLETRNVVALFRRSYILALSLVASLLIGLVLLSQRQLATQQEDASLINLAGRQRMLSQRVAKELLLYGRNHGANQPLVTDLLNQWNEAHQSLKKRAFSEGARALVMQIEPLLQTIVEQSKAYMQSENSQLLDNVLSEEGKFLELMEALVRTYELEAGNRVKTEIRLQWLMLLLLLTVLLAEAGFIFRPLTKKLQGAFLSAHEARREAEEALAVSQESDRLKGEFLANVSHEIRTPMNGILGMSELLVEREQDPDSRECARIIHHSAECLLSILNDLLDMSKIQAGEFQLLESEFDLWQEIEDVVKLQEVVASEKGLELLLNIQPEVARRVRGDQFRLRQVLLNLLTNAVKFTEIGRVKVSVSNTDSGIKFAVSDTGCGIPEHKLQEIFQPFRQLDGSHSRHHKGTGLGLAIASNLVRLMKGSLNVESQPGSGSNFWFTLALEAVPGPEIDGSSELRGKRILMVRNHSNDHLLLHRWAKPWGATVHDCRSVSEALEVAAKLPFDFVILDPQTPGLDPLEVPEILKKGRARLVALTTNPEHDTTIYQEAGYHGVVCKPLRRRVLELLLASLLDSRTEFASPDSLVLVAPEANPDQEKAVRILIVDDNRLNCDVAGRFLTRLGLESEQAFSGEEALKLCSTRTFDLVLMDLQMPEMDGFETTLRLRASGFTNAIVALTANPAKRIRQRCMEAGMDDFMSKPLCKEALFRVISQHVTSKSESLE